MYLENTKVCVECGTPFEGVRCPYGHNNLVRLREWKPTEEHEDTMTKQSAYYFFAVLAGVFLGYAWAWHHFGG